MDLSSYFTQLERVTSSRHDVHPCTKHFFLLSLTYFKYFYCMNVNKYWMRFLWYAEKSRSGRPRPWLFRTSQEPDPIIVFIIQCFEENNDENTEPCFNGCVPNAPAILDKIKWNSRPHPPPPPRQGWRRAKGKNAPFSHPWFGGEGGSRFSIYFVQDCGSRDSVIALGNHALG